MTMYPYTKKNCISHQIYFLLHVFGACLAVFIKSIQRKQKQQQHTKLSAYSAFHVVYNS